MYQKYSFCPKQLSEVSPFQDTIFPLQILKIHQTPNLQSPLMASHILLSTPIYSLSHHSNNLKFSSFHKPVKKFPIFKKPSIIQNPFKSLHILSKIGARASFEERELGDNEFLQVGEDAANFDISEQKISSWVYFTVILGVVLFALDALWIDSSFGFGYGKAFVDAVSGLSESHEVVMLLLIFIFAGFHSGMASLRDSGEKLIGPRAFRVVFAGISLPLAVSTVVYFINHRYDGIQLWQLQSVPWLHHLLWVSNFISFFFLYPSTFNLLEVAAVDKPKLHLWETGIMRITRHPQMVGQVIWCLAHAIWIGNSVAVAASVGLIGHHLFGVWNGDRRLSLRHGEAFEIVKSRTSVVPFAAILDGRQKLPKDYYKEFLRLPYLTITGITLGAYVAHPLMQAASYRLHW